MAQDTERRNRLALGRRQEALVFESGEHCLQVNCHRFNAALSDQPVWQRRDLRRTNLQPRRSQRRGMAPIELVLWAPILMFVAALIVVYGTSAAWRVRAEINSREAADRDVDPHSNRNMARQIDWPLADSDVYSRNSPEPIVSLDDPAIAHPVVRGPLGGGFEVYPTLDPDSRGAGEGTSEIDRIFPLLPRLGSYQSGKTRSFFLNDTWPISRMYFSGVIPIPHEAFLGGGYWAWEGIWSNFATIPNIFRRTKLIYLLPIVEGSMSARFAAAIDQILSYPQSEGLLVLDEDEDFIRYQGAAPDFYPRARILCELDRERVREQGLEGRVIDYLDGRGEVQLGGVTNLPRRLTNAFLFLYRTELARLEELPPSAEITAEINELETKIGQLEDYQQRLPDIEERLRENSTAR